MAVDGMQYQVEKMNEFLFRERSLFDHQSNIELSEHVGWEIRRIHLLVLF